MYAVIRLVSIHTERLQLINDVKKFCVEELGLTSNNSFTKIISDQRLYYILCISPKNGIKPNSPLTGVAYYNSLAEVNFITRYAQSSITKKLFSEIDICVQEVLAKVKTDEKDIQLTNEDIVEKTQITQTVLDMPKALIPGLIIHENFHMHALLNRINIDYYIEESIADTLGYQGSKQYYKNNTIVLKELEEHNNYQQRFYCWCNMYTKRLNKTYRISVPEGRKMLMEAQEDYKNNFPGEPDINNAFFMMWLPYTERNTAVRKILRKENPREHINKISRCAQIMTLKELEKIIKS